MTRTMQPFQIRISDMSNGKRQFYIQGATIAFRNNAPGPLPPCQKGIRPQPARANAIEIPTTKI